MKLDNAKDYLKNWASVKKICELLTETRNELDYDIKAINYDDVSLPGGTHTSIHKQYAKKMQEKEKYDLVIHEYQFFINNLERAINTLLDEEEKRAVIIYANNHNNSNQALVDAALQGFSKSNYYRTVNQAISKLDEILSWEKLGNFLGKTWD